MENSIPAYITSKSDQQFCSYQDPRTAWIGVKGEIEEIFKITWMKLMGTLGSYDDDITLSLTIVGITHGGTMWRRLDFGV